MEIKRRAQVEAAKFAILCSADYYDRLNKVLKARTVHFIGERDALVDNSLLLTE